MTIEVVATSEQLTRREREVFAVLMRGATSNLEICEALVIEDGTVRYHLAELRRKLGCDTRSRLIAYGYQHGIVLDGQWWPYA